MRTWVQLAPIMGGWKREFTDWTRFEHDILGSIIFKEHLKVLKVDKVDKEQLHQNTKANPRRVLEHQVTPNDLFE